MKTVNFIIRPGGRNDVPAMHALIRELAQYEKAEHEVLLTQEQMEADGFEDPVKFETFVAEVEGQVVGMALFYARYSTWKGATLHLEDLVVNASVRGIGIGKALFKEVAKLAQMRGVGRMEWEVLEWNEPAKEFYKMLRGSGDSEWELWKLNPEKIKAINEGT